MNIEELLATPSRVASLLADVSADAMKIRSADGELALVEHLCHLRDIEEEGYAVRIARLLSEHEPFLRDLDGDALARERRYIDQSADEALAAFAEARSRSVSLLRDCDESALAREGTFENVGRVSLAKLVAMMHEHDRDHLASIAALAAIARFERDKARFRDELDALCRIAGVSASDPVQVRASAEAVARLLERYGIGDVRLLEIEGAHPSVYGRIHVRDGAPTVLVYAHHDVQPPGNLGLWSTPPFEPVERDGRLYARGASDDKAGVIAHIAAVASYGRSLPCNVTFFIEGEEEIGSPNLPAFLERYRDLLHADCVVLADTPNYDTGIPALTYRLRGMCQIDVEVRCLERALHSGRGSGATPDAIAILCQLIASLAEPAAVRGEDPRFREAMGVLDGVALVGDAEDTWTKPAITVIGLDAPPVASSFNQISPSARARLSLRTVPPDDSAAAGERLVHRLMSFPMPHAIVTARVVKSVQWWITDPSGPLFDAARRALTRGYGADSRLIGSGGTIGFVGMFEEAFPGTPLLLMGVEDPPCNAHAEDESLHLQDWARCTRSAIFFYEELSRL